MIISNLHFVDLDNHKINKTLLELNNIDKIKYAISGFNRANLLLEEIIDRYSINKNPDDIELISQLLDIIKENENDVEKLYGLDELYRKINLLDNPILLEKMTEYYFKVNE